MLKALKKEEVAPTANHSRRGEEDKPRTFGSAKDDRGEAQKEKQTPS